VKLRGRVTRRQFLSGAAQSAGILALSACGGSDDALRSVTASRNPVPAAAGRVSGLSFPGSAGVERTVRFRFLNPLAIYPATYIWRAYPVRQAGYYTAFFWGNDDGKGNLETFDWVDGQAADTYYGAHPYPNPPPHGTSHDWEIAILQSDPVNGAVVYDRWYTQAFRAWPDGHSKRHEFYWDLPRVDTRHRVTVVADGDYGNRPPPVPALTWGDAPWNPGREVWCGMLRGIQIYSTRLSLPDILRETRTPLSTRAGAEHIWYLNLDPTPDDIADKSGRGHHPEWVGRERPGLWTGPG